METPVLRHASSPIEPGGANLITPGDSADSEIFRELTRKWFRPGTQRKPFTCYSKHNSNSVRKERKQFVEDAFRFYPKEVVMKFLAWAYKRHMRNYANKYLVFYNEDGMFLSPMKQRFSKAYLKSLIGRFWDLHQMTAGVHLILTASPKNYNDPLEGIKEVKERWNRFWTAIRKRFGKLKYLATIEPHKSGYYHMHVIIFGRMWLAKQDYLLSLWRAGEKGYGLFLKRVSGARGLNYVLKYLRKALSDGHAGLLVFSGTRQYSTSMDLVKKRETGDGKMSLLRTENQAVYLFENLEENTRNLSISAKDAEYRNIMDDAKGYDPPNVPDAVIASTFEWKKVSEIPFMHAVGYINNPLDAERYWKWLWY